MQADPQTLDVLEKLRWVAAVSGAFNPVSTLLKIGGEKIAADPNRMLDVVSLLRPDCTVERDDSQDLWTMRNSVRHEVLASPSPFAPGTEYSDAPTDVELALSGADRYSPGAISDLIAEASKPQPMLDLIKVLDRAGPQAPGFSQVSALRGAVNKLLQARANDQALAGGFFGREAELAKIERWMASPERWIRTNDHPGRQASATLRTLHVSGLPGIGKSYLLERIIQMARQRGMVILRLDFDRSSLNVQDDHALFDEISRQIGNGLPHTARLLREARFNRAETLADTENLSRRGRSREIMQAIRSALSGFDGTILILLDTLEVLRQRADSRIVRLFEHLDRLAEFAGCPICVISAGRKESILPAQSRVDPDSIDLIGLEDPVADTMLAQRGVAATERATILDMAQGIPLRLVLASKSLELGAHPDQHVPDDARGRKIEGYLYRAILSRVPRNLRDVALKGLILQRINADALREVVAPVLELEISKKEAGDILTELGRHHWLVRRDGPWVFHRSDLRAATLDLIYDEFPDIAREIDQKAADWFQGVSRVAALYHRLQMCRDPKVELPQISRVLAEEFTGHMLAELPARAGDAVRQAKRERSDFGRQDQIPQEEADLYELEDFAPLLEKEFGGDFWSGAAPAPSETRHAQPQLAFDPQQKRAIYVKPRDADLTFPVDDRAVRDVEIMLEKGELREIPGIMQSAFPKRFELASDAGVITMAHAWRSGQWTLANQILRALPMPFWEDALKRASPPLTRLLLEIWAEFRFEKCLGWLRAADRYEVLGKCANMRQSSMLTGCALDFMLLSVREITAFPWVTDETRALIFPFLTEGNEELAWRALDRADRLRANLGVQQTLDTGSGGLSPETQGRRIAPLNPYATPLVEFVRFDQMSDREGARLHSELASLRELYGEIGDLAAPDLQGLNDISSGLSSYASDAAEALANAGLAAETLGGYAFFRPDRDLPALADAAERWRRTVNGLWSYGAVPPDDWVSDIPVDHQALALTEHLQIPDRAEALLWLLAPRDRYGVQARRRLRRPYLNALAKGHGERIEILKLLQRDGLPLIQAATLTVFAVHEVTPETIFR